MRVAIGDFGVTAKGGKPILRDLRIGCVRKGSSSARGGKTMNGFD
jgi:hypothetical protein